MATLLRTATCPGTWELLRPQYDSNRFGRGNTVTGLQTGIIMCWVQAGPSNGKSKGAVGTSFRKVIGPSN